MERTSTRLAGLAVVVMSGCSGSGPPDIRGMWQVATHTENTSACDAEGPAVVDPPYINFVRESFFGQSWLTYESCDDPAGTSCTGGGLFSIAYFDEIEDGYRAEVTSSSGSGTSCSLSYVESTAIVQEDGSLRIETRSKSETITVASSDECTIDEARARKATMPCRNFEVITATRVVAP